MSDPQNPAEPPVPPAGQQPAGEQPAYQPPAGEQPAYQPPAYPPPAYQQPSGPPPAAPAYGAAPAYDPNAGGQAPYGAPTPTVPGKTLGIVAFVVAFPAGVIGIILGIVALVQSKKAGVKNGWAVAAIIVGSVLTVLGIIGVVVFFSVLFPVVNACLELGPGEWQLSNGQILDCD